MLGAASNFEVPFGLNNCAFSLMGFGEIGRSFRSGLPGCENIPMFKTLMFYIAEHHFYNNQKLKSLLLHI